MFVIKKQVWTCDDCPHIDTSSGMFEHFWCRKEDRQLPNKDIPKIPKWCTLNSGEEDESLRT